MLNPVKLHDSLWSISVASMLNWSSSVPGRYANGDFIGNNNGEGESSEGMQRLGGGDSEDLSSSPNFDSSPINHFSFSTNFLSRGLPEESCVSIKEKLIKQAAGKSFTIDSLLGITNAAQAIQNCILPAHHHHNHHTNHLENSPESKWFHEKVRYENVKDNRYNPYHRKDRNQASNNSGGPVSSQSDKQVDKLSKGSRRTTKSKRVRTIFTPEQLERLEAEFERQQYMVGPERLYLASSLYLTEAQVKVWFQNRRIKWRKQHLEMQQQRLAVFRSKRSNLENEEEEFEENSDSSQSVTLPSSDSGPSSGNLPMLTSFCGTLNQQETPSSSTHKEVLSDSNRSNSCSPTRHPSSSAHYDSLPFYKSHESSKLNDC